MAIDIAGAALRDIHRLFVDGTLSGLPDDQLLDRFLATRDGDAFDVLLARHGPMVFRVCRGVLRNPSDAEDAFQATFLVLVKKARVLRGRANLGGWLHRVAYRVAIQANAAAARRRVQERKAGEMAPTTFSSDLDIPDDIIPTIHEEIARLPEQVRLAVVLCDLQGIPQDQAVESLRLSDRTLRRRLAEGRQRLKVRLGRRGLGWGEAMMAAVRVREAGMSVPPAWRETTLRAALGFLDPTTAGAASAAAQSLTREVLHAMCARQLIVASTALVGAGLMAWAASAGLVSRGDEPKAATAPASRRAAPAPRLDPQLDPLDVTGTFPVRGRVLDPDGRPVADAEIHVRHFSFGPQTAANGTAPAHNRSERLATSDGDGRFRFDVDKSASDFPFRDDPGWHGTMIAAVAPGYGPAWTTAGSLLDGREAILRLVRDDVPIRGRVLDLQGRPVAGVTVSVSELRKADDGLEKDALLASGSIDFGKTASQYNGPIWLGKQGTWTTDEDGRFEVRGVGRDQIVGLEFESPSLAHTVLYAMAREPRVQTEPRPRPTRSSNRSMTGSPSAPPLVGATFEHLVGPTKPIAGVVRSKAAGKPLAGLRVWGAEPSTRTQVSTVTDAQGRFRLIGLPKGEAYEVGAAPRSGFDPYLGVRITVADTEGLKPIETSLEVPKGIIVTGRMIDPTTGRPVRAKHVMHTKVPANRNSGHSQGGSSNLVDPVFRITVPPGEGIIYANVRGTNLPYARARLRPADKGKGIGGIGDGETTTIRLDGYHAYRMVDVPADADSFEVELRLTRGETRRGKLVCPTRKPVAGAQCAGHSDAWAEVKTLAGDEFEVFGLTTGHPRLLAFAHRELGLVGSVVIGDEELRNDAPLLVRLERAGSIKGRLVDEDGLPVRGASFYIQTHIPDTQDLGAPLSGLWPDGVNWATDPEGRFRIDGLHPGLKTSIYVSGKTRPGYRLDAGDTLREIVVQSGEVRDLGDVRMKEVAIE
jgi:RNA polymerase sigma factor (sigma-70 family)